MKIPIFITSANSINKLNRCIMGNFQKLHVWQLAKELAVKIYKLTQNPKFKNDFGFKDQIQRSAMLSKLIKARGNNC
jgi:hypothetical protein